jgi:CheY-like chemotaxis protein
LARILIIDDDPLVRFTMRRVLAREVAGQPEHELVEADGGQSGVDAVRLAAFDLALVDMIMPEMSGLDVVPALRAERPRMRLIAVSGGARTDNASMLAAAERLGVDAVLHKPFTARELRAVVRGALAALPQFTG